MAAKTLMRPLAGASVPLWVTQMCYNMGFQYAGLTLVLISVLLQGWGCEEAVEQGDQVRGMI
jgi:hypothetical protein